MASRSSGGCRRNSNPRSITPAAPPAHSEPAMRRWPHPIAAQRAAEGWESQLYALRCQLDAQTRLLEEIRALLEQRGTGK